MGASWEPLGSLWGDLGASWGGLGAFWGGLARVYRPNIILICFWIDFEPILGSKRVPKGDQNGAQNGPKSKTKITMKKEGL